MEKCSSTTDQDHVRLQEIEYLPAQYERTPVPQTARRNGSSHQDGIKSVTHTVDRSVNWSKSVDGRPGEEAIMQISGAGHWFLEGWIGDYAVDFLVDSGSAVTTVSSSFYKNLRDVGALVGELRPTNRRLRGANGSRIDIMGCSDYRRSSPFWWGCCFIRMCVHRGALFYSSVFGGSSSLYHSVYAAQWTAGRVDRFLREYRRSSGPDTR